MSQQTTDRPSGAATPAGRIGPCPAWCTLQPGHSWDSIHGEANDVTAMRSRGHQGPTFGDHVSVDAIETDRQPGVFELGICVAGAEDVLDPQDALRLAGNLLNAWAFIAGSPS